MCSVQHWFLIYSDVCHYHYTKFVFLLVAWLVGDWSVCVRSLFFDQVSTHVNYISLESMRPQHRPSLANCSQYPDSIDFCTWRSLSCLSSRQVARLSPYFFGRDPCTNTNIRTVRSRFEQLLFQSCSVLSVRTNPQKTNKIRFWTFGRKQNTEHRPSKESNTRLKTYKTDGRCSFFYYMEIKSNVFTYATHIVAQCRY